MTENQVVRVQKTVMFLLFIGVGLGIWFYPRSKIDLPKQDVSIVATTPLVKDEKKGAGGKKEEPHAVVHYRLTEDTTEEDFGRIVANVEAPDRGVAILHFHLPGNQASENLADIFNGIQKKYGKFVRVTRIGFPAQPMDWQAKQGIRLPSVMMIVDKENAFQFQGLLPAAEIDKKVEELIFRVRRVGDDWRPSVSGMSPVKK